MSRIPATAVLDAVLDEGSFRSWDQPPVDVRPGPDYAAALAALG